MMRSMFSGVSGLKVHQTRMDVIGNNIANVNTVGYKSQRVTFSDVFSQTISSASSASDDTGRGGVNAMQVGLGVSVASIDMLMTQGAAQRTDNPFDVMIDGDGFMVVGDATGKYYTRAGALRLDDEGNLVIPNGMKVQGWLATTDADGNSVINSQEVTDINLFSPQYQSTEPTITTKAQIAGNLCTTDTDKETTISFYDSLGNYYSLPINMKNNKDGTWDVETVTNANNKSYITDSKGNQIEIEKITGIPLTLTFGTDGKLKEPTDQAFTLDLTNVTTPANSKLGSITVDLSGVTQYATKSTAVGKATNGNGAGTLSGYSIGDDGVITATYTNGDIKQIAQVVLANFDNPEGLEKVGDNLYSATANSGEFDGIGEAGTFKTGVLEMSNVDLSSEFTDMIITQRGFQANSRIITVSDEMLQELTNLKR